CGYAFVVRVLAQVAPTSELVEWLGDGIGGGRAEFLRKSGVNLLGAQVHLEPFLGADEHRHHGTVELGVGCVEVGEGAVVAVGCVRPRGFAGGWGRKRRHRSQYRPSDGARVAFGETGVCTAGSSPVSGSSGWSTTLC